MIWAEDHTSIKNLVESTFGYLRGDDDPDLRFHSEWSQLIFGRPPFLRVWRDGPFDMTENQSFEFSVMTLKKIHGIDRQSHKYQILTVVRFAQQNKGVQDSIRVYGDNHTEMQIYPEQEKDNRPVWTSLDNYDFLLIY